MRMGDLYSERPQDLIGSGNKRVMASQFVNTYRGKTGILSKNFTHTSALAETS
jgi:hypothetical protein